MRMRSRAVVVVLGCLGGLGSLGSLGSALAAQGRSAAVESTLPALPKSLYFVMAAKKPAATGKQHGLVVVLPGGDGSREFLPWVESSLLLQRPDDCVGVLITSVMWQPDQRVIWPTAADKVPSMEYTTEQYVRAVVAEVAKKTPVDPARSVVVAWSSSGAAIHPLLAQPDSPFQRAYIAMSIFPPGLDLAAVKGRRYVLDQSPEDQTTIFQHVRTAHAALGKAGALVMVTTYAGGHGWHDEPLPRFRKGLEWLLADEPAPKPVWPPPKAARQAGKLLNQLANGGFEQGLQGWNTIANSGRCTFEVDKKEKAGGKQSLRLQKTGGAPFDLLVQSTELAPGKQVTASVQLKSKGVENAWIKVRLFDAEGKELHENVNLVQVPADSQWKQHTNDWPAPGAVRATVQVLMVGAGELWLDDVVMTVAQ